MVAPNEKSGDQQPFIQLILRENKSVPDFVPINPVVVDIWSGLNESDISWGNMIITSLLPFNISTILSRLVHLFSKCPVFAWTPKGPHSLTDHWMVLKTQVLNPISGFVCFWFVGKHHSHAFFCTSISSTVWSVFHIFFLYSLFKISGK